MSKKYNNSGKERYRIVVIGNRGYPIHTIECSQYSIDGEMVSWESTYDQNVKCYHVKAGEQVDVEVIN